jgi:tRNA pseudouridine55 synthase
MADFKLGITTDTQDITGTVTSQNTIGVTEEDINVILTQFRGDILQTPPMYSAVKVGGKKLYELARKGIEVERKPKKITIHDITLAGFYEGEGSIIVTCSSGTYIRTLIHDIGQCLKCGAVMTELIRTKACGYALKDCLSIDEVEDLIHNS